MAGAVFVVYLSMLVNPRYPGAQYAFLSGFAFLLPRLLSGAGGSIVEALDRAGYRGFDLFFILSGVLSLAALFFLPMITRARARPADDRMIEELTHQAFAPAAAAVADGRIPGAALGVVAADGQRAVRVAGMAALLPEPEALTEEHWFDLASVYQGDRHDRR